MDTLIKRYAVMGLGLAAVLALVLLAFLERPGLRLEQAAASQMRLLQVVTGMRAELRKALEAEKSALLAPAREQASRFAEQAEQAARAVEQGRESLEKGLRVDGAAALLEPLDAFNRAWAELREIDKEFLPMVVQKTNTLASMLSYSEGVAALERLEGSLRKAMDLAPDKDGRTAAACFSVLAEAAKILALQGPHIAEASEARMDALEAAMRAGTDRARAALADAAGRARGPELAALDGARRDMDAFLEVNSRILALSRINSDVKSLALSMQRKQNAAAACEAALAAIQARIEERLSKATR